jgi:hypothetical protein
MKSRIIFAMLASAALLLGTSSSAATKRCVGQTRQGDGAAVVAMDMEDGQMKQMIMVLSRVPVTVPGSGAAAGADVRVQLDEKLTMGDKQMFDGLGISLTFLNHAVKTPIDVAFTVGGIEAGIGNVSPDADGSYSVRLGSGLLKGNKLGDAIDAATSARIKVVLSSAKDQDLINAVVPLGTVKEREAVGLAAMDAATTKAKAGC